MSRVGGESNVYAATNEVAAVGGFICRLLRRWLDYMTREGKPASEEAVDGSDEAQLPPTNIRLTQIDAQIFSQSCVAMTA